MKPSRIPVDMAGNGPFAQLPASGRADGRDQHGRFTVGHPGPALKDGRASRLIRAGAWPDAEVAIALKARADAILTDLGGAEEVSTVRRELVVRFVETSAIADWLASNLAEFGVLTGKGRTRAAVSAYLQVTDRLLALGKVIGLDRRAKHGSFIEALAASVAAEKAVAAAPGTDQQPACGEAADVDHAPCGAD